MQPHSQYIALGRELETRQEAYRDLFRFKLDEAAISNLRLALQQGQAVGSEKFKNAMSVASGVRRTKTKRGRQVKALTEAEAEAETETETETRLNLTDFGF